jgi:valyl-tRNA synthetase
MSQNKRELASTFSPADIESPLYEKWIKAGYFTADNTSEKEPYTIVIPPPNVTGSLHIGHALDHTLQDVLIRMKRMKGFEALWLERRGDWYLSQQKIAEARTSYQAAWKIMLQAKELPDESRRLLKVKLDAVGGV